VTRKVLIACSPGGHLAQMHWLSEWWGRGDRVWVTLDGPDVDERLRGERVILAHGPTNRSPGAFAKNLALARRVLRDERPDVVVGNGAGVTVPFVWVAATMGIPTVFVEVYDRVDAPSLTGRLVRPFVDRIVLQWEAQRAFFPEGVVLGPIR